MDYALTGKKGTGKSKNMLLIIRDEYLKKGLRVASNLDIFLEPMFGPYSKATYIRVPDKPTEFDLYAVGKGYDGSDHDEERFGCLALDELGTWLNTRSFADKTRAGMLDYLAHARKMRFNCYYLMQNIVQVDKQVRESFIEFTTRHTRFDRVQWPFVGGLLSALFGRRAGYMPKFHTAVTRIGYGPMDLKTESKMFIGADIHKCYDTEQVFRTDYEHGTYSVLSPWHVKGRFMVAATLPWWVRLAKWARGEYLPGRPLPVTRPHAGLVRVRELARALPVDQGVAVVSRYIRSLESIEATPW